MKAWITGCLLLLIGSADAQEAVTRAWHFSLSPVGEFLNYARPKEMAELPQPSVFANKGDRLIDLTESECFKIAKDHKAWLVWNDTQKRLIAHGNPLVLAFAEQHETFQRNVKAKVTISWYRNVPLGDSVPDHIPPEHQLEVLMRSGHKENSFWSSSKAERLQRIELEQDSTFSGEPEALRFYGSYHLQWTEQAGPDKWDWTLNTSHDGKDGEVKTIAQVSSPSGEIWSITCKAAGVLEDGTLVKNSRWIESDGKAMLITNKEQTAAQVPREWKMGGRTYHMGDYSVPSDAYHVFVERPEIGGDPFAEQPAPAEKVRFDFQAMEIPVELKQWAPFPMIDLGKWLREHGVPLGEKDFAGYDPVHRRVLAAVEKYETLDLIEQFIEPVCARVPPAMEMDFKIRHEQSGKLLSVSGYKIGCPSGQKAWIQCTDPKGQPMIKGIFEPTLAADGQLVDLYADMDWKAKSPEISIQLKNSVTLLDGVESTLQTNKSGDITTKVTMKTKVLRAE